MNINLAFVGGCPRSGTTLVKRILDAHPRVYCGPEFGHLPRLAELYRTMKKGIELRRIGVYATNESLRQSFRTFMLSFFEPLAERFDVDLIVEKTPDNLLEFMALHEIFPEARLIHVIRNPLDVVASYLRCGARMPSSDGDEKSPFRSAKAAAMAWKKRIIHLKRIPEQFDDASFQRAYMEVRYEDVIADPEGFARRVSDFLKIPFDPSMLDTERQLKGDAEVFGNVFYTRDEYQSKIVDNRVGGWEDVLDREQLRSVLDIVGGDIVRYGYMTKNELEALRSNKLASNANPVKDSTSN